ncbi:MAG: alcohol dehydrogenase catalytic domain-containing protein [Candidatus Lernaella stagnicola]|nr:alcohol dehydrogenase catalytic domain-containing protein [Candidatus Lernaella stagnicola]
MSEMRAAVVHTFDDVRVESVPRPTAPPGGLLVHTHACGICSGDVMPWYIERKAPLVLGHEMAGTVVEVGEGAPFAVGDRVFAHHHAPCMECAYCNRGHYVQCATWKEPAVDPGGCAEYFAVTANGTENDTLLVPPSLSLEHACLIEPLACAVKALRRVPPIARGGVVAILGLGAMGIILTALAKYFGAWQVIGIDRIPYRLNLAADIGADHLIDFSRQDVVATVRQITSGMGADLVIVGPPSVEAMRTGLECAGKAATVLFFSPAEPDQTFAYDPNRPYFDEISFVTSYSCGPPDTREALSLLADGVLRVDKIITHRFPLDQAPTAYRLTASGGESSKVLVTLE